MSLEDRAKLVATRIKEIYIYIYIYSVQEIVEDSKSKTIKFPHIDKAKLQEPAYVHDWIERTLALISAHAYYAPILGSDGFFLPDAGSLLCSPQVP